MKMKIGLLLAAASLSGFPAGAELFSVTIETGTRHTATGTAVDYSLFVPEEAHDLPRPPWPVVLLHHGFARSPQVFANTALRMARRGFIVMTPDQAGLGGIGTREENIAVTLDHLAWLRERGRTPGDPLDGLVDPHRMALAGHSAGGAVSFEAAVRSQTTEAPVAALFLLDAVPWRSTLEAAPELAPIPFGSLRAEPSSCNAQGSVRDLLAELPFCAEDVLVVGATHCDPENPTDLLCRVICGGSSGFKRYLFFRLMTSFFQEALNVPQVEAIPLPYGPTLEWLEANGFVIREVVE
jgi:pimeloyl-ACP methyl ester carboxylesterase